MDRQKRNQSRTTCLILCVAAVSGCATLNPAPEPDRIAATADGGSDHGLILPAPEEAEVPEPSGEAETPDAGLIPASAGPARTRMGSDYHLSADTGWLVLPVPRIVDDLEPPARSGVELSSVGLPLPRVPSPARSRLSVASVGDSDSGADGLRGRLPAVVSSTGSGEPSSVEIPASETTAADVNVQQREPAAGQDVSPAARVSGGPIEQLVREQIAASSNSPARAVRPSAEPVASGNAVLRDAPFLAADSSLTDDAASRTERGAELPPSTTGVPVIGSWVPGFDAVTGTAISITLPGTGWIYVGNEYGSGTADLIRKTSVGGDDQFQFIVSQGGEYGLWFQREDVGSGEIVNQRIAVTAADSPEPEPEPVVGSRVAEVPSPGRVVSDHAVVDDTVAANTVAEVPSWTDEVDAALSRGDRLEAGRVYMRVISAGGDEGRLAARRYFELATDGTDINLLGDAIAALDESGGLMSADLQTAMEQLRSADGNENPIDSYEAIIASDRTFPGMDEAYFRLAGELRRPGQERDLKRARYLYVRIVDDFPLSRFWDQSAAAIEYLDRHFFEVR